MKFLFIEGDELYTTYLCQNPVSYYTFAELIYSNMLNQFVVNVKAQSLSMEQINFIQFKLSELNK